MENDKKIIKVSAGLIFRENNGKKQFLICQRPEYKARGLDWEFVGGKLEKGETGEQALIRECKEELDIYVKPISEFMKVVHKYPDITIELTIYIAQIESGEIKLLEHNAMAWITSEEIDNYEFCPADKNILAKIKELY